MQLADLLEAHRAAFEYDWRARFSLPLSAVGTKRMTWGEAIRLTQVLAGDPSSQVAAALAGWSHPVERFDLVLRDLFDLQHASKVTKGRPKPYPRPWDKARKRTKPSPSLTQDEIIAALRRAGHTAPIPTR